MRIIVLAVLMCACQAAQDPENCQPPELNDGFFIPNSKSYKTGDKISYGCNTGLKPDLKTWWGEITCKNGEWSHTPRCINNTWCITTHVPNAKPDVLQAAAPGTHDFECDYGYGIEGGKSIAECASASWTLPECKRNPDFCAPPPRVNNGMITTPYRNIFENGQTLEYICARGYRLDGVKFNTCRRGTWSSNPSCVEVKCTVQPYVAYAGATERFKLSYSHGDTVRFICNDGYEFEGTDTARCEDGDWKLPVCKVEVKCNQPYMYYARATEGFKLSYNHGDTVRFICNEGYKFEGTDTARCEEGTWKLPVCKYSTSCSRPYVENARLVHPLKVLYTHGEHVKFACDSGYKLEHGSAYATCNLGTWRLPVCKGAGGGGGAEPLHPDQFGVLLPVSACGSHPLIANGDVIELPSGKELKVQCVRYYKLVGPEKVGCVQGEWTELPVCKLALDGGGGEFRPDQFGFLLPVSACGTHPLIANGDVTATRSGKELKVQCVKLYKLDGPKTVGCVQGEWTALPVCKPPCKVEGERIHSGQSDEYLQEGDEKRYYCGVFKKITVRCLDGTPSYSECKWSL